MYKGRSESDLRREVGPPTRQRVVAELEQHEVCRREPGAVRELTYDVPSRGWEKRLDEILGLPPAMSNIVCVDEMGKIITVCFSVIN